MALPATDQFTAANGTELTAYAPANWAYLPSSNYRINTNQVYQHSAGEGAACWIGDTFAADQYAQLVISVAGNGQYVGPAVRCSASTATYYGFYVSGTDWWFFKSVGGTWVEFATGSGSLVGSTVRLEVEGTALRVYVNGSLFRSATDSSIAAGNPGVTGYASSTGNTFTRGDSFEAGNLGPAGVVLDAGIADGTGSAVTPTVQHSDITVTPASAAGIGDALSPSLLFGSALVALSPAVGSGRAVSPVVQVDGDILETFEAVQGDWAASTEATGSVLRSGAQSRSGSFSAACATTASGQYARVYSTFSDPAASHSWQERTRTHHWQRGYVYVPSATVAALGGSGYLTIAGMWASGSAHRWHLRVRQGGALSVQGYDADGNSGEYSVYGAIPLDQWVELEIGLRTQGGPGVKRAFAFLVNGGFYGWVHQGWMTTETYNRAAFGILDTNITAPLTVYVDDWCSPSTGSVPLGTDNRTSDALQTIDFREQSGVNWQVDWSTWRSSLTMNATHGLYSATSRLQSGRNLDLAPDLTEGWGEIVVGWPNGTPGNPGSGYSSAMIGFRKEINREENLEIIPLGNGSNGYNLVFEAWVPGGPIILAQWPLPVASASGLRIPEPNDIILARWEQASATHIRVCASFYDASADLWYTDIIDHTFNASDVNGVNYNDGYHTMSSITIDSTSYSIKTFRTGTLDTYPANSVTLDAGVAEGVGDAVGATVVLGDISLPAGEAAGAGQAVTPTVLLSDITLDLADALTGYGVAVTPTVSLSDLTFDLTGDAVGVGEAVTPTILSVGVVIDLAGNCIGEGDAAAPLVVLGGMLISLTASLGHGDAIDPQLYLSSVLITPQAAAGVGRVRNPYVATSGDGGQPSDDEEDTILTLLALWQRRL